MRNDNVGRCTVAHHNFARFDPYKDVTLGRFIIGDRELFQAQVIVDVAGKHLTGLFFEVAFTEVELYKSLLTLFVG